MTATENIGMADLCFFASAVIGMTHIVVDSVFFLPLREWLAGRADETYGRRPWRILKFAHKVVQCYQCCGTWVGFLMGFLLLSYHPVMVVAAGCAGSFLAYTAAVVLTYFEANSVPHSKE